MRNQKAVAIFSGGLDSSTMLYYLLSSGKYDVVYPMTVNYNQKNRLREAQAARQILRRLASKFPDSLHKLRTVSVRLNNILTTSSLVAENVEIPNASYSLKSVAPSSSADDPTVVPFRNGILASISATYAVSVNANEIHFGGLRSGLEVIPHFDSTMSFILSMQHTILAGCGPNHNIKLTAPLFDLGKEGVVKLAVSLGVPINLTYSCYRGRKKHCGTCRACYERKTGFANAGVQDITTYES